MTLQKGELFTDNAKLFELLLAFFLKEDYAFEHSSFLAARIGSYREFRHGFRGVCEFKMRPKVAGKCRPGSSEVEHLHGKQVVAGSIPVLGKNKS